MPYTIKKNKIEITIIIFLLNIGVIYTQSAHKNLRNADNLYGFGKYLEAETAYRKAESLSPSLKANYNLGNTLMQQERYDEAIKKYEEAALKASSENEKATVFHNLGNALYKKQQFHESIEAYKNALKHRPSDTETKENLAIARKELKKQDNQKKKDKENQDKKNKDQQNQKDQNQNNQDNTQNKDQQSQQNQEEQQNKQQPNQQNQSPDQSQNQSDKKMSRQDAQKLLEVMENEEKKVQQKLRRVSSKSSKVKKDW